MDWKKLTVVGATMVCAGALLTGCGSSNESGSASGSAVTGSVSTNGSTSMEKVIGTVSEQFMNDNQGIKVTYDATGSGTGIESVNKGTCDIGLSSRALKDSEKQNGLKGTTIALDGIAIIVNENNPVNDLSKEDLAALYTGQKATWDTVGGSKDEVAAIGREAGSGTRDGFESITKTKDKCKMKQELTSTGAVIEAVKNSPNAIGYASYASVVGQKGIKVLTIGGVQCTEENIANGSYVVQRPFVLVTKEGKELSPAAKKFFDYATSTAVNELIKKAGAVPANK